MRLEIERLNDPSVMSAFQATIGDWFAPLATLVDKDSESDSIVTQLNKVVKGKPAEVLGKQHQNRKHLVTDEISDNCGQRRDLKKNRGEIEGAKDNREIKDIRKDMKMVQKSCIEGPCQAVEA